MRVVIGMSLEPEQVERLRRDFPDVDFVEAEGGDALLQALPGSEVLFGGRLKPDHLEAASSLRWIQAFSAGVNHFPMEELRRRAILLTNASGAHEIPIAENILAMMLAFAIRLPDFIRAQERREWERGDLASDKFELSGGTLLIAGLGGIGSGLAVRAKALGMHVLGVRNRPLPPPPGVDEVYTPERLIEVLPRADHVALCLPLTQETTGYLGERELRLMKPSAHVYNVGRGQSIDRAALLRALEEGWIAGAGLDVTDPEPLPADDPLWGFPNVILSQHTSGSSSQLDRRVTDLFAANLRQFVRGEPLINLVDYSLGY